MKKLLFGFLFGLTLATVVGVSYAAMHSPNTIYDLSNQPEDSVSVFDDGKNKCYVAKGRATESKAFPGYDYSISCVRP